VANEWFTIAMYMTILEAPGTCSFGGKCTEREWMFNDAGADGVFTNLRYVGYPGLWMVDEKDLSAGGWKVYWKTEPQVEKPVQFDLVPVKG
jgi:hypothetical protein